MAAKKDCGCGSKLRGQRVTVKLAGGTKITKKNLKEATDYAARHPGAKICSSSTC